MKTKLLYFSKWRQFCIVDEIILDIQKKDVEVRQKITKIGSGILNTQVVKRPGPDFLHHSVGVAVCVNNYKTPEIFAPTKPNPCVVRPATNGRTRHSSSLGYLILTQPLWRLGAADCRWSTRHHLATTVQPQWPELQSLVVNFWTAAVCDVVFTARRYASALYAAVACPSICLSVTSRYCAGSM